MADSLSRLRVGIVGLGRIGSGLDDPWFDRHLQDESWRDRPCTHAGFLIDHPAFELVAGADLDADRRVAFSRRWGIERTYPDHTALLEAERPDVVAVATRGVDHARPVLDAARAGVRGIFLEKHVAASLAEADAMIEACETNGVRVVMNHTFRLDPGIRQLQRLVAGGLVGEVRTIVAHFGPRLIHAGSHFFDLFRFFGGDATAVFGRVVGDASDDPAATGYVELANGVRCLFDARPKVASAYLDILGTQGTVRIGSDADVTLEHWALPGRHGPLDTVYQPRLEARPLPPLDPALDAAGHIRRGRNVTQLAFDELAACLREDRDSIVSIRDGRAALEIAMAVIESDRSGRLESLPLATRSWYVRAI